MSTVLIPTFERNETDSVSPILSSDELRKIDAYWHAYASLIQKLTYRRTNHAKFHVRGYKEKGNINTPLELAVLNEVDRFNLAIDVIDRVRTLEAAAAHTKEWLKDQIIDSVNYAHENGVDRQAIREWKWPGTFSQF